MASIRKRAPAYFKPNGGPEFATPSLSRFSISYGRSGMHAASVLDWNGDRVKGMGAGGCGYDKRGTCIGQVLAALAGPEGMLWLARTWGSNSGSDDPHGGQGLYGLRWYIVDQRKGMRRNEDKAAELTKRYRAKSHKAPKFAPKGFALAVGLDGACGTSSMETVALALGMSLSYVSTGKNGPDVYTVRKVRTCMEHYVAEDGSEGRGYLRARV